MGDDNVHISIHQFQIEDIRLLGTATANVPLLGEESADIAVTLTITKPYKSPAKVDVTNVEFPDSDVLNSIIGIDSVKGPLCDELETTINEKLAEHGADDDSDDEDA